MIMSVLIIGRGDDSLCVDSLFVASTSYRCEFGVNFFVGVAATRLQGSRVWFTSEGSVDIECSSGMMRGSRDIG